MEHEQHKPIRLWQRLSGIISSPGPTLEAVVEKPTVLGPALTIALVNLALFLVIMPKIKAFTLWVLEQTPQKIPPEQLAQVKEIAGMGAVVGGAISTFLSTFIIGLIVAVTFKLFNMIVGEEVTFKKLYAIGIITYVPMVIGGFLRTMLVASSPAEKMGSISTSASLLLPQGTNGPLYAVLSQIDPFYIWTLVLLAMGNAIAMKIKPRTAGIFVFGIWVLIAAFGVLMTYVNPQSYIGT